MDTTFTEREVFDARMGRVLTDDEIVAITPKRDRANALANFDRGMIYKQCDICHDYMCINNWDDRKSRTPKIYDLIVCPSCDPRNSDDRYMKTGYRIMHRRRLRVIHMARIVRAVALQPCFKGKGLGMGCKCASCTAGKLFPPF